MSLRDKFTAAHDGTLETKEADLLLREIADNFESYVMRAIRSGDVNTSYSDDPTVDFIMPPVTSVENLLQSSGFKKLQKVAQEADVAVSGTNSPAGFVVQVHFTRPYKHKNKAPTQNKNIAP